MISLKFDWQNPVPINQSASSVPITLNLASIVVVREIPSDNAVSSVNGKTGPVVVLTPTDIGADPAGTAESLLNDSPDFIAGIDAAWSI